MFRVAIQVTCMVLLASVFYDILSCNHFNKTHTYKCIKEVGSSKYGKLILKKWKRAKKKYLQALIWPSCNTPANSVQTETEVEPYVHLSGWPVNLKNNTISLMKYVFIYLGKNYSSFQYPVTLSLDNLLKVAKAGAAAISQQIWKCTETTVEFVTKLGLSH